MFYFKDDKSITVVMENGTTMKWDKSNPNYDKVVEKCKKEDWIAVEEYNNIEKKILENKIENTKEGIFITVNGHKNLITEENSKLIKFINLLINKGVVKQDIERIKPFLSNICDNPYIDCAEELYDFCKKMDFEITEDGCFLAYKKVRSDLGSVYDGGKTKHVIGQYTEVTDFDTNRDNECSKGLHFCSHGYLSGYSGDVILIVKVNPKDVVSIPKNYNFEKGRCKRYLPIAIIDSSTMFKDIKGESIENVKLIRKEFERMKETIEDMINELEENLD